MRTAILNRAKRASARSRRGAPLRVIGALCLLMACRSGGAAPSSSEPSSAVAENPVVRAEAPEEVAPVDTPSALTDEELVEAIVNKVWRYSIVETGTEEGIASTITARQEFIYARDGVYMAQIDLYLVMPGAQLPFTLTTRSGASVSLKEIKFHSLLASMGDWALQDGVVSSTGRRYTVKKRFPMMIDGQPLDAFLAQHDIDETEPNNANWVVVLRALGPSVEEGLTSAPQEDRTWTIESIEGTQLVSVNDKGEATQHEAIATLSEEEGVHDAPRDRGAARAARRASFR